MVGVASSGGGYPDIVCVAVEVAVRDGELVAVEVLVAVRDGVGDGNGVRVGVAVGSNDVAITRRETSSTYIALKVPLPSL